MNSKRKILCLSTSNYYPFPTRKQNIMNRMTDSEIIYVNPALTYISSLKDKGAKELVREYKKAPVCAMDHIWVYSQPPIIPFYNKQRLINKINQRRLAKYLAEIINHHGFGDDFWIWCYSPTVCDLIDPIARELKIDTAKLWQRVIYDCIDRHSAYPGLIDPLVVDTMEEDLARSAGTVFATAKGLYDRLNIFNNRTYLIPNACNFELFNKVAAMTKEGDCITFGFVGTLQECIEYSYIEALAKEFPGSKIQLIGNRLPGVDTASIEKYPNVEFLGLVPQAELPDIIKNFDICLNIFRNNNLSRDVSPLKFYEYLATGKPIVSTTVPLQILDYKDCIYIADGIDDFIKKCREALLESPDSEKRKMRLEEAKKCSWDERVKTMRAILNW